MVTPLQKQALALTNLIVVKKKKYWELNKKIAKLQGDFPTHLQIFDDEIGDFTIKLLDEILGDELASYFIYECQSGNPKFILDKGVKYPIKTIKDLEKYLEERNV